jgi:hypothetical protein
MPVRSLTLTFSDSAALQALFHEDLAKGRAFVPGATGVVEFEVCELVLQHDGRSHKLRAEAIFIKAEGLGCGVGLAFGPLDSSATAALEAFVSGPPADASVTRAEPEQAVIATVNDRIRGLSSVEQQRLAVNGTLHERVALERTFGPNVWEALLSNPRLTIPEVATIARKGTVPRPLIEILASRPAWVAAPEVQRALLSNLRATPAVISRVLQTMARTDLALVAKQTAYPHSVRALAKKILAAV